MWGVEPGGGVCRPLLRPAAVPPPPQSSGEEPGPRLTNKPKTKTRGHIRSNSETLQNFQCVSWLKTGRQADRDHVRERKARMRWASKGEGPATWT